jgi:hypothetical protein
MAFAFMLRKGSTAFWRSENELPGRRKLRRAFRPALREARHDVVAIAEVASGATDEQVLERALDDEWPVTSGEAIMDAFANPRNSL